MTSLVLDRNNWFRIQSRIKQEYGDPRDPFFLIRSRVERELGFTCRNHREWYHESGFRHDVRLDFGDPARATFFQIKYL